MGSPFIAAAVAAAAATVVAVFMAAVFMGSSLVNTTSTATSTAVAVLFVFLLNRAAAAAGAGAAAVAEFLRRAVKRKPAPNHAKTNHVSRADDKVPAIFLSHSGIQKGFVEHLYNALKNSHHIAFLDKHTLPKGSYFPSHIIRAVDGCKLGVVVLSDDFLTSKWPMVELEMLVKRDGVIVLPLFFKLSPDELKSAEKLSKWRQVWRDKYPDEQWPEWAVKKLSSINGEVLIPGGSEVTYINRVVHLICSIMQSPILYDLSPIQGHERFAREVASQFEKAARQSESDMQFEETARQSESDTQFEEAARQSDKVCMVGLYGVGGMGKTTICKVMCNFYASQYAGKCHHIEFPSDGDDKKIVKECKKALKKLAHLSDENLLNNVDSFDQVVQLMRENLGRYEVFLAIDNVWERSVEAAKRILGVSFRAKSKILLTSRSKEVLKDLAGSNTGVCPLPSLVQQEALQLFQQTFHLADINCMVETDLLHKVLRTCFFSGNYHALTLKAVAQHVKRVCLLEGLDKIECCLSDIQQGVVNDPTILQNVEGLIELNYVNLAAKKKHIFLDIVVVVMMGASRYDSEVAYEKGRQLLSTLYKKTRYSKSTITKLIYELALDGLIQLENTVDTSSKKMIRVHDLYFDLAQREAAGSSRFFTDKSNKSLKKIDWESLERVILYHKRPYCFIRELQQHDCQNLQVLIAENIDLSNIIDLDLMPSLCVLKLASGNLRSIENWSAATGLAIVSLVNLKCDPPLKPIPSMPCLKSLIIEKVKTLQSPPDVVGCQRLKKLVLAEAIVLEDCKPIYFSSLRKLESLQIDQFNSITRVLNLNGLVNLQLLHIQRCESVERIEGLDALKKLQSLYVKECPFLRDLDGLEVRGLRPAFKFVDVRGCGALRRMPDLSGLTGLESFVLCDNKSMEEVVGGLTSPALKKVEVRGCGALKRMADLSGLTCLESLVLCDNKLMEEVVGGLTSPALKNVEVCGCEELKRMPDLSRLTCLESLVLCDNKSMEELVGGLTSSALKNVEVRGCGALKRMPDLSGLTCLESLVLIDNKSMEKLVGGLTSSTLKKVVVSGCGALKRVPDLSGLTGLESLVGDLSNINVYVGSHEALKRMPDPVKRYDVPLSLVPV